MLSHNPRTFSGQRLRKARADRPLEAIALAVGVTVKTISNWEAGRSEPDASALALLSGATRRRLDYFFVKVA